jgi:integrase
MPRLADNAVPSYRLHKQSGQAIVTLCGKDFLLGTHGSAASRKEYGRLVAEWLANDRQIPVAAGGGASAGSGLTVNELILAYWRFAKGYYKKNGRHTSEIAALNQALEPLKDLYGKTLARDFRPLALQAVRATMIDRRWSRKSINTHVQRIKRMFKWAVARELVPADVHHGLGAVDGLRRGRSEAKETDPVRPVPDADVDAVITFLSPSLAKLIALQDQIGQLATQQRVQVPEHVRAEGRRLADLVPGESPVAAMVQVQRLTGMRSGELVIMRTGDIDTGGDTWVYTPTTHKTEHHDRPRPVYLGPRVREILRPFLSTDLTAYLFSPRDAVAARRRRMRELRKSKVQPSQLDRRVPRPLLAAGERYDTCSYRRAVKYACDQAGGNDWHPHQLRHNCATRLRQAFGIEAARVVLGHSSAAVTELYAEADQSKAAAVMAKVG